MLTQLVEYFTTNNLLSSQQFLFRSNRSTDLAAALELMDRNIKNMIDNLWSVNIYLDFSKLAFDSLNHIILVSQIKFYGIQQLYLLKSYLSNRSQYAQLDNVKSNHHTVLCDVPQGSVM